MLMMKEVAELVGQVLEESEGGQELFGIEPSPDQGPVRSTSEGREHSLCGRQEFGLVIRDDSPISLSHSLVKHEI